MGEEAGTTSSRPGCSSRSPSSVDDLKALKQLADPAKDQCEVWFYLYEMERLMKSWRADDDAKGEVVLEEPTSRSARSSIAGDPSCYEKAWHWIVVEFNTAEADEKLLKSQLEQAKKRAADLDKIAKEAETQASRMDPQGDQGEGLLRSDVAVPVAGSTRRATERPA